MHYFLLSRYVILSPAITRLPIRVNHHPRDEIENLNSHIHVQRDFYLPTKSFLDQLRLNNNNTIKIKQELVTIWLKFTENNYRSLYK
ncbi:hypothetical protein PUN28_001170 [Cardiocondyla obscurior]|uniref:Uncharacterized protein n=1 Tax=Cardiocondyla obscurior TaxID=286306 RepID=A0AAW2H3H7_9HYME